MSREVRVVPVPNRFDDWGASFGAIAPQYESLAFARGSTDRLGEAELAAMHLGLGGEPAGRVLDIGAGSGRVSRSLVEAGWSVTSMDASPEMLAVLARNVPDTTRVCGALGRPLPFADDRFDAVVALRVLKYVPQPEVALREIARVLRSNGRAVLEWTNRRSLARLGYRGAPIRFLARGEIERLAVDAGLHAVRCTAGSRLPHRVWQVASGPLATGALAGAERALALAATPFGSTAGARSVITTFVARAS
jgi:SAM-dependent methyltransferase